MKQEKLQEALDVFEAAVQYDPLNPQAHFQLAKLLVKMKQHAKARKQLKILLQLKADHSEARRLLESIQAK